MEGLNEPVTQVVEKAVKKLTLKQNVTSKKEEKLPSMDPGSSGK